MAAAARQQVAERFLDALEALDFDAAGEIFAEDGRLRALMPDALREDEGPAAIATRFRFWWDELADLKLVDRAGEQVRDRTSIRFRMRGRDAEDGWLETAFAGYLQADKSGRIVAMNLASSGFMSVS